MLVPQTEVIVLRDGAEIARRIVSPGEYVIGRDAECAIPVEDDNVSRAHARLTVNYNEWLIEDLGSRNGTLLNGRLVSGGSVKVFPTQLITIGPATIELRRVVSSDPDASLPPVEATVRRALPPEVRERQHRVGELVARGGMGAILTAEDAGLRRTVAMKVMLAANDESDVLRFIHEAQVTGQLEHPNIVPVHELSVDEQDQPYYTMKFVRGITLKKVLDLIASGAEATAGKYPLGALLTIFQKVCDALAFAHSRGVIHRDLKPENVMLDDFGVVLVMDWGLARGIADCGLRIADSSGGSEQSAIRNPQSAMGTQAGSILGTPQYMAPEQARGDTHLLDVRTDVYALGAILYQILTLHPPVEGGTLATVLDRVKRGVFPPPVVFTMGKKRLPHLPDGDVPEAISAVAMKALALRQDDRYQSVLEFQADVEAFQNGFATKAERAGLWKRGALFFKRHRVVSLAAAAVLLIGGTFGTQAIVEGRRARQLLARLHGTAPTFAAQAAALVESGKFDDALDKIGFAIELDDTNADFHLFRAHTLQATAHLPEAIASYRRVLALRPDDAAAKTNLDLCEKLLAENGGDPALTLPLKTMLLDAILAQKRQADAVPLSHELQRDTDTALATIKARLKTIMAQPGWKSEMLKREPDGSYRLDLSSVKVSDVSILQGLPISHLTLAGGEPIDLAPLRDLHLTNLSLSGRPLTDLSVLKGLPLRSLTLSGTPVADLSPLAGMPLQYLWVNGSKVTDLTPLRGLPLKRLDISATQVRDLRPVRDLPIENLTMSDTPTTSLEGVQKLPLNTLAMFRTPVEDLAPLRGSPVKEIWMDRCERIRDLTPLLDCKQLVAVTLPPHLSDIAFLKTHPSLKRISNHSIEYFVWTVGKIPTVTEFFQKHGDRLARQVPMEKQLEKFRQSLIAQGNGPSMVPQFAFAADGELEIKIEKLKCSDLAELRGVAVTSFNSNSRTLLDLSPLAGAPLKFLNIPQTAVHDLSPLKGAPLTVVRLYGTRVRDLSPLRGMPLEKFFFEGAAAIDASILAEFPTLQEVIVPTDATGIEALKRLPRLRLLSFSSTNTAGLTPAQTAAEFWKEFDARKK